MAFNRAIKKPKVGHLWRSRTYRLNEGDRLKIEVMANEEVVVRLVRVNMESATGIYDLMGPCKKCETVFSINETGEYRVVVDTDHPKVVITVKIDILR